MHTAQAEDIRMFDPPYLDYHICPDCRKIKRMTKQPDFNPYPEVCADCWFARADPVTGRVAKVKREKRV